MNNTTRGTAPLLTARCECENYQHFEEGEYQRHNILDRFDLADMHKVHTEFGTFRLCHDCYTTCHQEYLSECEPEPESESSKHCDLGYMNDLRFGG